MTEADKYRRRILLCVTGMAPQVVTESLYALAVARSPAFVPTEIHLISTTDGIERAELLLLSESKAHFRRLCDDYALRPIEFGREHMHVICDGEGRPLSDIRTPSDNAAAADTIGALVASLTADPDAALHVSIAGGRKTMGYYLGYALSLFGREQDRLSHVLVSPEYENLSDFFYPTPQQAILINHRTQQPLDAARAKVELAEIPFVRLREDLPRHLLAGTRFGDAVQAATKARSPAHLRVWLKDRAIECSGTRIELSPQSFVFYAWLAERCWDEVDDGGLVRPTEFNDPNSTLRRGLTAFGDRVFTNPFAEGYEQWKQWNPSDFGKPNSEWIYQRYNDLNNRLEAALGPGGMRPFAIQSVPVGGKKRAYRLDLKADQIEFVGDDG